MRFYGDEETDAGSAAGDRVPAGTGAADDGVGVTAMFELTRYDGRHRVRGNLSLDRVVPARRDGHLGVPILRGRGRSRSAGWPPIRSRSCR